jgi:hypothetical protein
VEEGQMLYIIALIVCVALAAGMIIYVIGMARAYNKFYKRTLKNK